MDPQPSGDSGFDYWRNCLDLPKVVKYRRIKILHEINCEYGIIRKSINTAHEPVEKGNSETRSVN